MICREHVDKSKYSDIKPGAVPICTLQCEEQVACLVSQAARATSAAPTFFPVQKIGDRYFVDGGMEFNNPSHAIYSHYRRSNSVANSGRISSIPTAASITDRHQGLDFSRVRIVNLGTGTKSKELPPRQRDRLANLVPGFIRMSLFLKRTLTEFAVNAEIMADVMASLVDASTGNVKYERFSADNGVCYIKMDKYKELSHIEKLTSAYVKKEVIQARLKQLGEDIAKEYLSKHPSSAVTESAPPTGLTIPNLNAPSSQDTLSQIPAASVSGTSAEASMNTCYDLSDHDLQSDETLIKQAKDLNSSPQRISSPDMATRQQLSADMAAQRTETVPDSRALTAY